METPWGGRSVGAAQGQGKGGGHALMEGQLVSALRTSGHQVET